MHEQMISSSPVHLVYFVALEDEVWCERLERHLLPLQQQQLLTTWSPQQILGGTGLQQEMETQLEQASIIVLLLSSNFVANKVCVSMMQKAVLSQKLVVPVLVHPFMWELTAIGHLTPLPGNGKPISVYPNSQVALQEIAREIYAHIDPQGAAQLPLLDGPSTADPDHRAFLNCLRTFYTEQLEGSLQKVTPIPLALHTKPDAVVFPARLMFWNFNRQTEILPSGTSIIEAYKKGGGRLLILGKPGAGKTMLLLHLAQDLLANARRGDQHCLPVIVNLSTWATKRQPLVSWLVETLYMRYQLPVKLGQQWAESGQFLLLLDGLDEVAASARGACINAINAYLRKYMAPLVVCCRTTDYSSQLPRLELLGAVIIQNLKQEEVDRYLAKVGSSLAALRAVLQQNTIWQELATTPLMLNVMIHAYRDSSMAVLPETSSLEELRREVFSCYVMRMLSLHRIDRPQRFLARLAWLARQMRDHSQTTFYLEQLQPSWLSDSRKFLYYWLAVRLPGIIMGILVISAVDLELAPSHSSMPSISLILLGGLLGGLFSGEYEKRYSPEEGNGAASTSWVHWFLRFSVSVLVCLGIALDYERYQLKSDLSLDLRLLSTPGPSLLLGILLLQVLLGNKSGARTYPTTQTIWQRFTKSPEVRNGLLVGMLLWLGLGLGYALYEMPFGLSYAWNAGLTYGLSSGLIYGLSFGLSSGLLSMLFSEIGTMVQPTDLLSLSRESLRKGLFSSSHLGLALQVAMAVAGGIAISAGLSTGLSNGLGSSVIYMLDSGLSNGLAIGLSVGLSYWFLFGLFESVSSKTIEARERKKPNQGIRHSGLNGIKLGFISAVFVGLSYTLSVGLAYVLGQGLQDGLRYESIGQGFKALLNALNYAFLGDGLIAGLSAGLRAGLCLGLLVGFYHGGLASLRHYTLRLLLSWLGSIPWGYIRFLEKATRCILLRKEGSGYAFNHSLLLDYIADYSAHLRIHEEKK